MNFPNRNTRKSAAGRANRRFTDHGLPNNHSYSKVKTLRVGAMVMMWVSPLQEGEFSLYHSSGTAVAKRTYNLLPPANGF
jgi:hypothetical protein